MYFRREIGYTKLLHIKYFVVSLCTKEIGNEYNGLYNTEWWLHIIC